MSLENSCKFQTELTKSRNDRLLFITTLLVLDTGTVVDVTKS